MLPRRKFLKCSLVGALWSAHRSLSAASTLPATTGVGAAPSEPGAGGLTTYQLGPQIWVRLENRLFTCYRAHRTQKYPYLYPVSGPATGLSLTSETSLPYPHHRSLFFGCDRVNGGNYWQEGYEQGQVLSHGPKLGVCTPAAVEILDACEWQRPGGPVIMKDQRRIVITTSGPRLRFIDWELRWQAVETVTIQKTNHSLFSARVALDLSAAGGGRLVNAEGESGEKATFGRKSAWCDFSGKREGTEGGVVEGLAILDHPANPWAPTPWFTRDYGFMSPTPMNFLDQPWSLPAGQSVTLRYRVVAHTGDAQEAGLADIYRQWAEKR